jgi:1-phosphofructokinase
MVYTVTLNPALDYIVRLDKFREGETNRAKHDGIHFGGKGINVSMMLRNLGVDSVVLGIVAGFTGKALDEALGNMGFKTDLVALNEGLTRINIKIKTERETEINAAGPAISQADLDLLYEKMKRLKDGDILVMSGSIPSSLPSGVYRDILATLGDLDLLTVVDTAGDALCAALPLRPFLIKPNVAELGEVFGKELDDDEEIYACAEELRARGARNVLVSLGEKGSILVDETGKRHRVKAPQGNVINSVGAGDAMVAGFLFGWMKTGDYGTAHRYGAAAGSATAFSDGFATLDQVNELLETL